mmetsp:Transcript_24255/g.52324  ORF Transcript_24255/g.52324 Transcript_24255/m.52324 type:complete len:207 (+) Transcript_24255:193-813(+)
MHGLCSQTAANAPSTTARLHAARRVSKTFIATISVLLASQPAMTLAQPERRGTLSCVRRSSSEKGRDDGSVGLSLVCAASLCGWRCSSVSLTQFSAIRRSCSHVHSRSQTLSSHASRSMPTSVASASACTRGTVPSSPSGLKHPLSPAVASYFSSSLACGARTHRMCTSISTEAMSCGVPQRLDARRGEAGCSCRRIPVKTFMVGR